MKKWWIIVSLAIFIIIIFIVTLPKNQKVVIPEYPNINMKITSTAFENNEPIPAKYTADGENINPQLKVSEIPSEAKSLVLIMDDPDAQKVVGYTWIHWVSFDIPVEGDTLEIEENSKPGKPGESTYKKPEYGGPNPPAGSGIHNYNFKIYALDKTLDLPKMSSLESIQNEMKDHLLGESILTGKYSRD